MRCSVCHDNAMNEQGVVDHTSFPEEIRLPECKMESEIETLCIDEFHRKHPDLYSENTRCGGLKSDFESAVARHEQAVAMVAELSHAVHVELPGKIEAKTWVIGNETENKNKMEAAISKIRFDENNVQDNCSKHFELA